MREQAVESGNFFLRSLLVEHDLVARQLSHVLNLNLQSQLVGCICGAAQHQLSLIGRVGLSETLERIP